MFCSIFPPSQLTFCCHENAFYCLWMFDFGDVPSLTSFVMWVSQYSDGHSICIKFQCFKCAQRLSAQVVRNAHHPQLVLGTFLNVRFCTVITCVYVRVYVCVYIYIYTHIYTHTYICLWCALWINQLLILWCYKQTWCRTHYPQTQPYSV